MIYPKGKADVRKVVIVINATTTFRHDAWQDYLDAIRRADYRIA